MNFHVWLLRTANRFLIDSHVCDEARARVPPITRILWSSAQQRTRTLEVGRDENDRAHRPFRILNGSQSKGEERKRQLTMTTQCE